MRNEPKKHARSWQTVALSVLCVFLALVLIVMIFATAYVNRLLGRIGRVPSDDNGPSNDIQAVPTEETDPNSTAPTVDPTDVTVGTVPVRPPEDINREGIINILLVGQDRRPGEGRQRSDSMILCSFNLNTNEITMISFLRDSYVHIPGYRDEKLNAAYSHGGFTCLDQTLAVNFGVHVDANVEVDFDGFQNVIDLLGGVDINLTEKEVKYMKDSWGIEKKPGINHLNGWEALHYSRIRYIDGDAFRAGRQRTVLKAIIEKYKNIGIAEMLSLLEQILPMITTDMSDDQIIDYAWDLFPMLATANIASQQIPASGTYYDAHVGDVKDAKIMDMDKNREILKGILENP